MVKCYTKKPIPVNLQFFIDIASQLKCFLGDFQTDKPMVLLLESTLVDISHKLMKMIVKTEVLDGICVGNVSSFKLFKINLAKSENLVHHEFVKLATATKGLLKSLALLVDKKTSILKRMQSQSGCINQEIPR